MNNTVDNIRSLADSIGDNREKAAVGDKAFAIWFDDGRWWSFTISKLDAGIVGGMDLGFSDDGNTYDIGLADKVIVVK